MKQFQQLKQELHDKEQEYLEVKEKCKQLKKEVSDLNQKVENYEGAKPVKVTEHALVRFLERKGLMNPDGYRKAIRDQIQDKVNALGDGDYPLGDGLYAKVKDYNVVTIYNE